MRIAYLDCFSGISGDMFLGALLDAGVPFELFQKTVAGLNIGAAGAFARRPGGHFRHQTRRHREWREGHAARGVLGRSPCRPAIRTNTTDHHDRRHLSAILQIIAAAPVSERAKHTASEIFRALGAAEAKVHNVSMEDVHFHEVGAADAIVDILCAAVGAEALGVEQFISSPLNVGGGTVACAHGVMPVPAPATLELLQGAPIYSGDIQKELVTPTGAAIIKVLVSSFGPRPMMTTEKIGYGAGARDFSGHPNVLRLSVGETTAACVRLQR